ncbi:Torso-like protein [Gryllus bimaculatus]|nr:Torso-like protein [Gryllus bimaculatus]
MAVSIMRENRDKTTAIHPAPHSQVLQKESEESDHGEEWNTSNHTWIHLKPSKEETEGNILKAKYSLFRVFVYSQQIFRNLKQRLKTQGATELSNSDLASFFSPWYAEHIGRIQSASGNATVEAWAARELRVHYYFYAYQNLLKLNGNAKLLRVLDGLLGNEALLQLDLRTLVPAFKDPTKRQWFQEVVDNYLKLWEVNM